MDKSWLEQELARQLKPASAPDDLWQRIHEQRRPLRVGPDRRIQWSVALAALAAFFAILAWPAPKAPKPAPFASQTCFLCHAPAPALAVVR